MPFNDVDIDFIVKTTRPMRRGTSPLRGEVLRERYLAKRRLEQDAIRRTTAATSTRGWLTWAGLLVRKLRLMARDRVLD